MGGKPVSRGRTLGGLGPQRSCEPSHQPGEAQGPLASAGGIWIAQKPRTGHLPTDFRETPAWLGLGMEVDATSRPSGHGGAEHIPQCSPATSVHVRGSWIHGAPSSASAGTLSITASLTTWPWRAGVFTPASGLWRRRKGFRGGRALAKAVLWLEDSRPRLPSKGPRRGAPSPVAGPLQREPRGALSPGLLALGMHRTCAALAFERPPWAPHSGSGCAMPSRGLKSGGILVLTVLSKKNSTFTYPQSVSPHWLPRVLVDPTGMC